jgi:phenylalanyl-tRNA synthetase beta chain
MIVSLSWLRRYADLPTDPSEISTALTAVGFEVEGVTARGAGVTGVVVGEVKTCAKHPEADKLSVCTVFDGVETVSVVCGAPNVAAGQKVLFARVGAVLPGDFKIKKAKLRGVESFGMICAEDELGLGESHDGILVLPEDAVPGTPLADIPGLCDTAFEISVTPNRPDALGHVGVARELAARFGVPLRLPEARLHETGAEVASLASLQVEDAEGCPRYTGRVVEGVKVGPSPAWLANALKSVGKKPINNVVDVTNFVLMEWGQPSHAFDLVKLQGESAGASVVVRRAVSGESLKTLDGAERALDARDLVIADAQRPQVLAGVMGGEDSGVSESTTSVLLEVAWFEPRAVRAQSRRHGLSSDSSQRFERGVDPLSTARVSDYLAALVAEVCGGEDVRVAKGRLDFAAPSHPTAPREVALRPARAERVLGITVDAESAEALLAPLGLRAVDRDVQGRAIRFAIPGFRVDLEREADLIEEIARRHDYNAIPAVLPSFPLRPVGLPPGEVQARAVRHALRDLGLSEALSLRFMSRRALAGLGLSPEDPRNAAAPLRNPLSEEWELLPTTPIPALLQALERNQNIQEHDVRLFELGRAFFARPLAGERDTGVREEPVLGVALMGEWRDNPWEGRKQPVDFARLKGVVEGLLERLRVDLSLEPGSATGYLHPVESATLRDPATNAIVGVFGSLHPAAQAAYGLKLPVAVAEISLDALLAAPRRALKFTAYETHPGSTRDVNALVPEAVRHADVLAAVPKDIANLRGARLNSVYRGKGVPEGHKALHYTFSYRHAERALTDDEVNAAHAQVVAALSGVPGLAIK